MILHEAFTYCLQQEGLNLFREKRIEDYRLKELIIEDLKIYGEAQIGDIHQRIGTEISRKRIKHAVEILESEKVIGRRGKGRYTFYHLLSPLFKK